MKNFTRLVLCFFILFIFSGLSVASAQNAATARAYRFLIPEGYVGWVRVDFNIAGAPELPIEDGFYVFKFPKSGRLQTSSSDNRISRHDEYYYYSDTTKYKLENSATLPNCAVLQEFSGPGTANYIPVAHYRYILIGPESHLADYLSINSKNIPKEADLLPKVGAMKWLTEEQLTDINIKRPKALSSSTH
jgi:hypothetical protein